jgi:hypothetical protein
MLRTTAVVCLAGSAAAFAPMMSMDIDRRTVVQTGVAGAVAAPLLRASEAQAAPLGSRFSFPYDKAPKTPVITVFDHRGCNRGSENKEYRGKLTEGQDDEMLVKVANVATKADEGKAAAFLAEAISFTAKGIDGTYSQGYKMASGDHENVIR